jgi:site-specific recombinase XerD
LLSYLEHSRSKKGFSDGKQAPEAPLFFSETYHPLTINALTLVFGQLRKRAGMTEDQVTPSLLRETFTVRSLQAGGEPEALRAILGLTGMESVKRYEQNSIGSRSTKKQAASEEALFGGNEEPSAAWN